MGSIEILNSGYAIGQVHMRRDEELLCQLHDSSPVCVHHYDWLGDNLTYGYFSNPSRCLNMEAIERRGVHLAKRPTGGGILFHGTDLAFSVLIPAHHPRFSLNTLENYALVNQAVLKAIQLFLGEQGFLTLSLEPEPPKHGYAAYCMARPSRYDLLYRGKKIGGAAQRRTHRGLLHQGSIYLAMPSQQLLSDVLQHSVEVIQAMSQASHPLLGIKPSAKDILSARHALREQLVQSLVLNLSA